MKNHLQCHCCNNRKPREGFKMLGDREVFICATCWPAVKEAMGDGEFAKLLESRAASFGASFVGKLARQLECA